MYSSLLLFDDDDSSSDDSSFDDISIDDAQDVLRQDRSYIPRIAILDPRVSPWVKLHSSGNEAAMIAFTNLNYSTFNFIAVRFEPLYNQFTPYSRDGRIVLKEIRGRYRRPRSLDSRGCLALVLSHIRCRGSINIQCLLFGLTRSPALKFLKFGRRILVKVLRSIPGAAIRMPSIGDIRIFQQIIANRFPSLEGVWFVMDGLKIPIQAAGSYSTQLLFYNGWLHAHFITNVFVFSPDGCIVACSVNNPGCIRDSQIADLGGIYQKLEHQFQLCGGIGIGDSAFSRQRLPFLLKTSQHIPTGLNETDSRRMRDAITVRQAAEWGNRAYQASFPRLYDTLPYEEIGERLLLLLSTVYLYNFRSIYVGYNQIQSVYIPHLAQNNVNTIYEWITNM